MIVVDAVRRHLRRWLCAGCKTRNETVDLSRLERAEQLHTLSGLAVANETEKQIKRVGDMRIAASAAVRRLAHEKREIEEGGQR